MYDGLRHHPADFKLRAAAGLSAKIAGVFSGRVSLRYDKATNIKRRY